MKRFLLISILLPFIFAGCENRPSVTWQKFTPEKLSEAVQNHQPAFVDFYAAWCGPCMIMKDTTFKDPSVIAALEPFMRLKADMSFRESQETLHYSQQYEIEGLPTVIIFNSRGEEAFRTHFVSARELVRIIEKFQEKLN